MRKFIDRIKRRFGYYPGAFSWDSPIPKPRHTPIPLPELRQRIMGRVEAELEPLGFGRPVKKYEVWVRRRTPFMYDAIRLQFRSTPSVGLVEVMFGAYLHLPMVERIYHRLSGQAYSSVSCTVGLRLSDKIRKEIIPRWHFWASAYSEEAMQSILDQIREYGLPALEQVKDYDAVLALLSSSWLGTERKAILLALLGQTEEVRNLLEPAIEKQRTSHKGEPLLDTFVDWKVKIGLLESIKSGQFRELAENETAKHFKLESGSGTAEV